MAKKKQKKVQAYSIIKLAPNVSAWCDPSNNIYLSRAKNTSKRLHDGCDMKAINKAIKAGLLILKQCEEEIIEFVEVAEPVTPVPEEPKVEKKTRAKKVKEEVKVEVNVIKDEPDKEE